MSRGEPTGDEFHEVEPTKSLHDMSIMLTVTNREGGNLPEGCLMAPNVARLFQERTDYLPYEVSILNESHAVADFEKEVPLIEVTQGLHGVTSWGELEVRIGCIVSGKDSLINICREEEVRQQQKENIKNQLADMRQEQQNHREQFGDIVKELQAKMLEIERKGEERGVPFPGGSGGIFIGGNKKEVGKLSKAPELPKFSGVEPIPREGGSFEQWYFQVKGSQSQHTEDAIQSGIINSVRGEARDLVEYVGFDAPISTILDRLEHRFRKSKSTDRLQHDFFQLAQEKGEGVQQYAR